jgi:succinyl-CoA synthetase alpha subunit
MKKIVILRNIYRDSFELMQFSERIRNLEGVSDAAILMGTGNNKKRLESLGFNKEELLSASNNDICVGINYVDKSSLVIVEKEIDDFLKGINKFKTENTVSTGFKPQSIESGLKFLPGANLVSISLPGEFAVEEARKSLNHNLNVFLFSDNISIEDELELKNIALSKNLFLMGPDCGTSLIRGIPLGFCNIVSRGQVGLVAASGTGAQEIICILDQFGIGISHIIGTGGRDLSKSIKGITSRMGLTALSQDPFTKVIILISKPADTSVRQQIEEFANTLNKPVVSCIIGDVSGNTVGLKNLIRTGSINHAAMIAASLINGKRLPKQLTFSYFSRTHTEELNQLRNSLSPKQRYVRGLYSGGTLADEAAILLSALLPEVHAGTGFKDVLPIRNWEKSETNTMLDLGDDRFTQGRPHPMIDPGIRLQRFSQESEDPEVAVIILDIVMGTNTLEDPVSKFVSSIRQAKEKAQVEGRNLIVIVHICASSKDKFNFPTTQAEQFREAGCIVFDTNEEAVFMAGGILKNL